MNRTEGTGRIGGPSTPWLPAVVGILAVVPFALLELVNRSGLNEAFPFVLFVLLWVLPGVLFWVIVLGVLAWFWIVILTDQMPCFLGVPNCD
jgi:hypothetical protein